MKPTSFDTIILILIAFVAVAIQEDQKLQAIAVWPVLAILITLYAGLKKIIEFFLNNLKGRNV